MQQQITRYVCQWRHAKGGFSAHVTTHSEHDLRL
jgi:hypothetical protein